MGLSERFCMLDWIKGVLATPTPSDLIERKFLASVLKLFIWILIAAILLHGGISLMISFAQNISAVLLFYLPCLAVCVALQILLQRRQLRLALGVLVYGLWLFFSVIVGLAGGVHSPAFIGGYLILILLTDFLLNFRATLIVAGLSTISGVSLAIADTYGIISLPDPQFAVFTSVVVLILAIIASLAMVRLINYRIYQTFVQMDVEMARRQTSESNLATKERRFEALLEHNHDMVAVMDAAAHITYASPSIGHILGYPVTQAGLVLGFDFIHPDDLGRTQSVLGRLITQPGSIHQTELRMRHQDGNWRWIDITANNQIGNPDVRGIILNFRDITEHKREEEQREHDSIHDALTGLCNRLLFSDRLENLIRRSQRDETATFAVLILDIDHFKNINDSLGHDAGDEMLITVARKLTSLIRATDTVARLSGDEFGVLLDQNEGSVGVEVIAERIEQEITRDPIHISGRDLVITSSLGIVISDLQYLRPEEYLRDAEIAMYRAKAWGRAQHVFFEDRMRKGVLERVGLEAELRRALEKHEFVVYYQPVFSLQHGELVGFEALVRWQHPTRGLLLPGEFIEVAEDSGLVVDLDRWVMGEACRQNRAWQLGHEDSPPLIINVNLSRRQLIKADLIETVSRILKETQLDARLLRPEITESLIMENIDFAIGTLDELNKMGVRTEIDDFGCGYSSLAVLTRLPVRTLKIDRSFVMSIGNGDERDEVIRTIIALGHSLNLEIIAEGIETTEQLKQLTQLGCEYGQGFLFSKGLDPIGAEALITKKVSAFSF
jgi:diguanylate cyclase (GGDEF)-like protein/PAS domain S-box-containing protein